MPDATSSTFVRMKRVHINHVPSFVEKVLTDALLFLDIQDLISIGLASSNLHFVARHAVQYRPVDVTVILPIFNAYFVGLSIAVPVPKL